MGLSKDCEETNEDSEVLAVEELRDTSVREGVVAGRVKECGNRDDGSTRGILEQLQIRAFRGTPLTPHHALLPGTCRSISHSVKFLSSVDSFSDWVAWIGHSGNGMAKT